MSERYGVFKWKKSGMFTVYEAIVVCDNAHEASDYMIRCDMHDDSYVIRRISQPTYHTEIDRMVEPEPYTCAGCMWLGSDVLCPGKEHRPGCWTPPPADKSQPTPDHIADTSKMIAQPTGARTPRDGKERYNVYPEGISELLPCYLPGENCRVPLLPGFYLDRDVLCKDDLPVLEQRMSPLCQPPEQLIYPFRADECENCEYPEHCNQCPVEPKEPNKAQGRKQPVRWRDGWLAWWSGSLWKIQEVRGFVMICECVSAAHVGMLMEIVCEFATRPTRARLAVTIPGTDVQAWAWERDNGGVWYKRSDDGYTQTIYRDIAEALHLNIVPVDQVAEMYGGKFPPEE